MKLQPTYQYDVFISYSHEDRAWVRDVLLRRLKNEGIKVLSDDDFDYGNLHHSMLKAISISRHAILVLSPSYFNSEMTEFENTLAWMRDPAGKNLRRILLLLERCELPDDLRMIKYADFTRRENYEIEFSRLVEQIKADGQPEAVPDARAKATGGLSEPAAFTAGPPIRDPRQFFGRSREVRRITNLLKATPLQNTAVVGPRRSGKTSLLLFLKGLAEAPMEHLSRYQDAEWLPHIRRCRWVFLNFQNPKLSTPRGVIAQMLAAIGASTPEPWSFQDGVDLFVRHSDAPTVILMDEIGAGIERYKDELKEEFWWGIRSILTTEGNGNFACVTASTEQPETFSPPTGPSPFVNIIAQTISLTHFSDREARDLVLSSPQPFPKEDIDWILQESKMWPLLLQILCRERLYALRDADRADWKKEGLLQIQPFKHLLESL